MAEMGCPQCNGGEFKQIEQVQSVTEVSFERRDDGQIEIDVDPMGEFIKEDGTSTVIAYMCSNENCGYAFEPAQLNEVLVEIG